MARSKGSHRLVHFVFCLIIAPAALAIAQPIEEIRVDSAGDIDGDDLFAGNGEILCQDAADGNDDGRLDVADAIFVLDHLFGGGAPLPPPFPEPGVDPTVDGLGCGTAR